MLLTSGSSSSNMSCVTRESTFWFVCWLPRSFQSCQPRLFARRVLIQAKYLAVQSSCDACTQWKSFVFSWMWDGHHSECMPAFACACTCHTQRKALKDIAYKKLALLSATTHQQLPYRKTGPAYTKLALLKAATRQQLACTTGSPA